MQLSRIPRRILLLSLTATAALTGACSDDDDDTTGPGNTAVVGTWEVTSFTANDTDFIANGMTLTATLAANGTYTFDVTNDQIGVCEGEVADCSTSGEYEASASTVTIDAGSVDAVTFDYDIDGGTMTWNGDVNGVPATVTLVPAV